ncbi:MAG: hypothetical protein M9925_15790 [Chloroflexi bacterium]|nr:hypothetical protein [Chloroflexota bacterium]PWB42635.1 MAG: hypothetical protein C3F10_12865 [Dehalococcoidia bacterium]
MVKTLDTNALDAALAVMCRMHGAEAVIQQAIIGRAVLGALNDDGADLTVWREGGKIALLNQAGDGEVVTVEISF